MSIKYIALEVWDPWDNQNTTLGIHVQEYESKIDHKGNIYPMYEIYLGIFLFRIVIEVIGKTKYTQLK